MQDSVKPLYLKCPRNEDGTRDLKSLRKYDGTGYLKCSRKGCGTFSILSKFLQDRQSTYRINMGVVLFLALLTIRLSVVRGIICNDDLSLGQDTFEKHGCTCGTNSSITSTVGQLFALYDQAYDDCYEDGIGDTYTIDCSFTTLGHDENLIMASLNRTMLDELPVGWRDVYENITCL